MRGVVPSVFNFGYGIFGWFFIGLALMIFAEVLTLQNDVTNLMIEISLLYQQVFCFLLSGNNSGAEGVPGVSGQIIFGLLGE